MISKMFRWMAYGILILIGTLFMALVTKAVLDNIFYPQREQPIIIDNMRLEKMLVGPGDRLLVVINGSIINRHCDHIYLLGSVVGEQNKVVQLDKIIALNKTTLEELLVDHAPLGVTPPLLDPGSYQFRLEIHEICGSQSYVILAPLTSFAVRAK